MRYNDLEQNIQTLVEAKLINLDVSLATLVKGGVLAGLDPWDVFCGNGWIIRRRGPLGPLGPRDLDGGSIRNVIREELASSGLVKG